MKMNGILLNKNNIKFLSVILILMFSLSCQISPAEAKNSYKKGYKTAHKYKKYRKYRKRRRKYSKYRLQRYYLSPKITKNGAKKLTSRLKKLGAYKVYINRKKSCIGVKYSRLKLTTIPIIKNIRALGYRIRRIN
jgi:hypothetical protein